MVRWLVGALAIGGVLAQDGAGIWAGNGTDLEAVRRQLYIPRLGVTPGSGNGTSFGSLGAVQPNTGAVRAHTYTHAKQTISIRVVAGMGNRLRQILGAYFYATTVAQVSLRVVWRPDAFCNANYNDLFEDIEGVTVTAEGSAPMAKRGGLSLIIEQWLQQDRAHRVPPGWVLDPKTRKYTLPKGQSANTLSMKLYSLVRPHRALAANIHQFVFENHVTTNAVAVHVRRTDQLGGNIVTSDEEFFEWIDARTEDARRMRSAAKSLSPEVEAVGDIKVFLATDNKESRANFKARYGDRLLVYGSIPDQGETQVRMTPVTNAVIDIFIASFAQEFKGTTGSKRGSSFSAMIFQIWRGRSMHKALRTCSPKVVDTACYLAGGRGWLKEPHTLDYVSGKRVAQKLDVAGLEALPPPPPPAP